MVRLADILNGQIGHYVTIAEVRYCIIVLIIFSVLGKIANSQIPTKPEEIPHGPQLNI